VNKIEFQDSIKVTVYQTVVADKFWGGWVNAHSCRSEESISLVMQVD
jgi:hypothetical protein